MFGFLWVLIIPKWLIKVSGWIATLVGSFWELAKKRQKLDPQAS